MERKPKVTAEVVANACDELLKEGKNATVNAVIGITGGSFSTVGNMVKQWREQQREKSAPAFDMPDSVITAMRNAAADIWTTASSLAGESVETIQKQAQEAADKASTELAEYAEEVTRLESEMVAAAQQADTLKSTLEQSQAQYAQLTAEQAGLKARLDDRDNELERLRADYEKLQAELIEIAKAGK